MANKIHDPKRVMLLLILSVVVSVTGCVGNYSEPNNTNMSNAGVATVGVDNAPYDAHPLENLSFYMNDSQRFELRFDQNQEEPDAVVQRFYVEDFNWVGNSAHPTVAITYKDHGENVTQLFRMQSYEIDKIYMQKNKVAEVITIWPAYTPSVTSYNNINYDENGTNPYYRPLS